MGGHGGLNILPQKKWNVYGRENRLRVARDEAACEEEQARLEKKRSAAESEHRLSLLKKRARMKYGGAASVNLDLLEESIESGQQQQVEARSLPAVASATARPTEIRVPGNGPRNPERSVEERLERRRRGDPATQTSDAKFDQKFAFGAGLVKNGEDFVDLPWYATSRHFVNNTKTSVNARGSEMEQQQPERPGLLIDQVHVEKRQKHHTGDRAKRKGSDDGKASAAAAAVSWDLLRKERLLREEEEQRRQAAAVFQHKFGSGGNSQRSSRGHQGRKT